MALVTVAPSGGDYTSLSAAEAGEQQDLTALGEIMEIECAAMTDTTAVTFAGWTTSSSFFVRVKAAAGAEAVMPFAVGAGAYTQQTASTSGGFFLNACDFMEVVGIQVDNTASGAGGTPRGFRISIGGAGVTNLLDSCIVRMSGTGAASKSAFFVTNSGGVVHINNCVGYGCNVGQVFEGVRSITARNCTAADSVTGYLRSGGTFTTINCLETNCTTGWSGTFTSSDYNASEDTTAPGSNSRVSQTFTFVDAGAGDWHLASGDAGAKGFGTDLSGEATYPFSDDIDGQSRGATWDIGADQFVSSGTTVDLLPSPVRLSGTLAAATATSALAVGAASVRAAARLAPATAASDLAIVASAIRSATRVTPPTAASELAVVAATIRTVPRVTPSTLQFIIAVAIAGAPIRIAFRLGAVSVEQALALLPAPTRAALRLTPATAASDLALVAAALRGTPRLTGAMASTGIAVRAAQLRVAFRLAGLTLAEPVPIVGARVTDFSGPLVSVLDASGPLVQLTDRSAVLVTVTDAQE